MRKLYILLALILGPLMTVLAQPTMTIGDGEACTGETFCVPFTVRDFTNINSLRFSVNYDTTVLRFTTAQNFNTEMANAPGNLGVGLFSEATLGEISFETWETGDCTDPGNTGVTLPDATTIFELCFEAVGEYGEQSAISITNTPTSIRCTRNATLCNNIGLLIEDGEVTLCVREINVTAADVSGNEGDQVCVDFVVDGFDDMKGMQFTVNYDPTVLEFVSLLPNTDIPANSGGAYGDPTETDEGAGTITVAWTYTIENPPSVDVADGTTFFTVCFDIIGDCETTTPITFSNTPTMIQANNEDPENPNLSQEVPISLNVGSVTVNDCNPEGIEIKIDCGQPANINDIVCVDFLAGSNFQSVRELEYLMSWNPSLLEFVSVDDPGNNLAGLDAGDFDTSNTDNGILGLEWSFTAGPAQNLTDMQFIYEVCFRVVGVGGDSPIQIITPGVGVTNNTNIGINPTNCVVEINQPESLVLDFGDVSIPFGGMDCVPVTASNFNDMLDVSFTMSWDDAIFLYTGTVQNINAALISNGPPAFTPVGAASLAFDFSTATPLTLPDNTVLFEACFEALGMPGDCDELITVGFPFPETAITANSNGENVGIEVFSGDLCVLFPDGFGLTAENTTVGWLDTVCMNFTVESFDDITTAEFNVNWVPTVLDYVSSSAIGWDVGATTFTILPPGTLQVTYNSPTPAPLPDNDIAFEVCFQAIGDPNDCYNVGIQSDPAPTVTTTGGPGSMVITNGEICVEEQIVIRDIIIIPPSCPGSCDGEVIITVEEWSGQGFIGTTWKTEPNQFTPLMLEDVCEGELCFTIFDNSSGVSLTDTITIVSDGVIPTAIINGEDIRTLDCAGGQVLVSAEQQDDVTYTWWMNAVGSQFCGDERTVFATSTGNKILCVTDNISGCVAYDTIMIIAPNAPEAIVNQDIMGITCETDCVTLMGSGNGENLTYQWSIINGNPATVDSTTINSQNFTVCGPGRYRLTVTDAVTGCTNSTEDPFDEGIVVDDRILPNVCLDPENGGDITLEQNCDGTPHLFDASCSDNDGQDVVYEWYDVAPDGSLSEFAIEAGLTLERSELGTYAMLVTNLTSGCLDTAFANIVPNVNAPIVSIDPVPAFTCSTDSIVLAASYTPNDPTFTFVWELTAGASFSAGGENSLNPSALSAGNYRLIITNPNNLCVGDSTIIIEDLTALPLAEIVDDPANQILDCTISSVLLDGTPSDDNMSYQWFDMDGMPIAGATADTLRVNEPGDYSLQVTNLATDCSATDVVTVIGEFETPFLTPSLLEATISCRNMLASTTVTVDSVELFTVGEWTTTTPGGSIANVSTDGLTVEVDAPGVYNVTVTSTVSGCRAEVDFVVSADFDEPTIGVASNILSIDCTQPTVQLSGAGSETGQNIVYLWENMDAGAPVDPAALVTDTEFPGTYLFTVTDTLNGCSSDTMVMVMMDTIAPVGMIAPVADVTCADSVRTLIVEVSGADDFQVSWIGDLLPMPTTGAEVMTTTTGTFTAVVVNTANACTDTVMVAIGGDLEPPALDILVPEQMDCGDESVILTIDGDADDYSFIRWLSPDISPLGADLTQEATTLGTYSVLVVGAENGCPAEGMVTVTAVDELDLPEIVPPAMIREFDCNGDPVTIDASETGDFMDYTILWESTTPFNITADSFIIEALGAGTFDLTITLDGPVPGCTNMVTFNVALDADTPVADAGMDVELPCGGTANLNTSGSTPMSTEFTYEWIGAGEMLSGPNPLVSTEGMYQLIVSNTSNGCSDTSEVVTVSVLDADFNIMVSDIDVTCGETGNLSATADLAPSATVTYDWIGTPELEDGTATPAVTEAGMYQLIITNTQNGCTDTSAVATVNLLLPPAANAGMDQSICGDEADLSGNIPAAPAGITGAWTNATGAIIDMPNAPTTMVSNLAQGGNSFTWTLSTALCPDYSSDEVILNRAVEFVANPDFLEIASDEVMGEVSLIANDVLGGAEFTINVTSPPAFGSFDTTALNMGNLIYMVDILQSGQASMTYEICSVECPDICATATVTIQIGERDDSFVPNTITPNNDGANDELVFDVLLFNPAEDFPDNELIIFNRWGDIIYEAKPYNNDWNGQNKDGTIVPEATYYYVLRLNIGRGEILKGDITVIR